VLRTVPNKTVRLVLPTQQRDYRGDLRPTGPDHRPAGRGSTRCGWRTTCGPVVPGESFSTWEPAALRAQSVALGLRDVADPQRPPGGGTADVCDTTACQVYHGMRRLNRSGKVTKYWEAASTDGAIRETAGQ